MVELLPNVRLQDAYAGQWVNVRDLLSHRAGFPAFFGDLFDHLGYEPRDVLRRIRYVKPATSFRDRPAYSNIGFFLAGELAAAAGGQPFTDLSRNLIFQPLAMTRTGIASALIGERPGQSGALTDVSRSHALVGDRLQVVPPNLSGVFIPAGGFASSANDLGRFVAMLARGGELGGQRVLSEQAVKDLFEPVIAEEPGFAEFPPIDEHSGFDYSPGWGVYQYNGLKVLEKGGASMACAPCCWWCPRSASPWRSWPTATSRPCRKRCAPPCCSRPSADRANPTCSRRSGPRPTSSKASFWLSK